MFRYVCPLNLPVCDRKCGVLPPFIRYSSMSWCLDGAYEELLFTVVRELQLRSG